MGVIAVIGGTGKVGRRVIEGLRGNKLRALARAASSVDELTGYDYVETRIADLDDRSSLESALQGAERLFIASPYHPDQGLRERNAILAAQLAGVRHVVKISSYSAGIEPEVPISRGHKIAENALRETAMTWSVLRPDWWFDTLSFAELAPRLSTATGKSLEFVNDVSQSWEPGCADAMRELFELSSSSPQS